MDNPELKLLGNYKLPKDRRNPELLGHKLQVFSYNNDDQRICTALSTMRFHDQIIFAQYWAPIYFKSASATVLTTRGQPFAHSTYTDEFWSYRIRCLDRNSYVNHNTKVCIGLPAHVFLNQIPEWIQDINKYNDILYPQPKDAMCMLSFVMPVIEGDECIGALELVMTNMKDNFSHETSQVCMALEDVGLKSLVPNENINCDISKDYSSLAESSGIKIGSRNSKSCKVTCNDITKLFGMPKADAAKICGISSENTFTKVHRQFGIDKWPCVRQGVVKSSAHDALELGSAYHTSFDHETQTQQFKHIKDLLMQDDDDDVNCEDALVEKYMNYLVSNDGKRVREQNDESPNPVLLELYHHKNKRSRI